MKNVVKSLFAILKCINLDTHLWCISVLAGAILLCISFFVEPSQRQYETVKNDTAAIARQKVIEYSSVLGSLSSIDSLEEKEVEQIALAIPDNASASIDEEVLASFDELYNNDDDKEAEGDDGQEQLVSTNVRNVDLSKVYSPEAIDELERLVQCEAASEDLEGRRLVANVGLNRVASGIWGDDISSVVNAQGQFQPVDNGAVKIITVDSLTRKAVLSALLGEDDSQGAMYFQKSNDKVWGDKKYLFRHGSHSFYR